MTQALLPLDDLATVPTLRFFVEGKPQTAGSKRAFVNPNTGKAVVVNDGNQGMKKTWRGDLRDGAKDAMAALGGADGLRMAALKLTVVCVRARPKAHLGADGLVKDRYRLVRPTQRPDTVKLVRAAEDALTGVVWVDDSQVVEHALFKVYGDQFGAAPSTEGLALVIGVAPVYDGAVIIPPRE